MKITIVPDYDAMSLAGADRVTATLRRRPDCALCLPTGNTPLGMFKALLERIENGTLDASQAEFFLLDEYVGLDDNDPESLTGWLMDAFLKPAGIAPAKIHEMPTKAHDLDRAAAEYEAELQRFGGYELAVLGLGGNGHIAYNEPGATADSRTRVLTLTDESIEQARGYFEGRTVPTQAMSAGVQTLLEARSIVLLVSGAAKAEVLRAALQEAPTSNNPASFLQLASDKVEVICDAAAGSLLN
ncbi:MAG TPA: glucosamine-6-phosphate deaminase [Thermomicrobiales bacterium]|nr:glucosamine-6-phosphate deaminase [Thermomicrobiales bacterium]